MARSDNLPVSVAQKPDKWESNAQWCFNMTLLKGASLCCSKAQIVLRACRAVILTHRKLPLTATSQRHWQFHSLWLQWRRNPPSMSGCAFHSSACFVFQICSSSSQWDPLYAVLRCFALVWCLTCLLHRFTL